MIRCPRASRAEMTPGGKPSSRARVPSCRTCHRAQHLPPEDLGLPLEVVVVGDEGGETAEVLGDLLQERPFHLVADTDAEYQRIERPGGDERSIRTAPLCLLGHDVAQDRHVEGFVGDAVLTGGVMAATSTAPPQACWCSM